MAKLERKIECNLGDLLCYVEDGIINGSTSATLEEYSDFQIGDAMCSVRVFERYSVMGGNRVSLSVTFFCREGEAVYVSAIASGGAQAVFWKVNTLGEENFLDCLRELLDNFC